MKRQFTVAALAGLGLLLSMGLPVSAQTLCSKPVQPLCTTDMQATDTGPERLRCLEDTARYSEGLNDYRDCLNEALAAAERLVEDTKQFRDCLQDNGENCVIEDAN